MTLEDVREAAMSLPAEAVAALGAAAAFVAVLAAGVQLSARRLRDELSRAQEELVDPVTGLLPRAALPVRLGAEVEWAASSGVPLSIAAVRVRGSRFRHAGRALRHAMREEEQGFLLGEQRIAVELWGADRDAACAAVRRIAAELAHAGHPVVDAGIATAPDDGHDLDDLLPIAMRSMQPAEEAGLHAPLPHGRHRRLTAVQHQLSLLARVVLPFAAMTLLFLSAWRVVPAAVEPALTGTWSGRGIAVALVAAVGVPLAAALLHVSCWRMAGERAPRSRPGGPAGLRGAIAVLLVVGLPMAWGVFAPAYPAAIADAWGATLALIALLGLALLHSRQLVHVAAPLLLALVLVGAAAVWAAVELADAPLVASGGQLLGAAALGALLARLVERASWLAAVALLAGAADLASWWSGEMLATRLVGDAGADPATIRDLLMLRGPGIDGAPLLSIGVTELVLVALVLAWWHDWRMDMRLASAVVLAGLWFGAAVGEYRGEPAPLLPFVAAGVLLVMIGRSMLLRARVARRRRALGP